MSHLNFVYQSTRRLATRGQQLRNEFSLLFIKSLHQEPEIETTRFFTPFRIMRMVHEFR